MQFILSHESSSNYAISYRYLIFSKTIDTGRRWKRYKARTLIQLNLFTTAMLGSTPKRDKMKSIRTPPRTRQIIPILAVTLGYLPFQTKQPRYYWPPPPVALSLYR